MKKSMSGRLFSLSSKSSKTKLEEHTVQEGSNVDWSAEETHIKGNVLSQLRSSTQTKQECVEQALQEEYAFLKDEYARMVECYGEESQQANTVNVLLKSARDRLHELLVSARDR